MRRISISDRMTGLLSISRGNGDLSDIVNHTGHSDAFDPVRIDSRFPGDRSSQIGNTPLVTGRIGIPRLHHQGDGFDGSPQGLPQVLTTLRQFRLHLPPLGDVAEIGKRAGFIIIGKGDSRGLDSR